MTASPSASSYDIHGPATHLPPVRQHLSGQEREPTHTNQAHEDSPGRDPEIEAQG